MAELDKVMSWLEGLTWDDWSDYHSDSEVQNIAKKALELLKEQDEQKRQWLIEIADNQIAHAPYPNKDEYTRGIYDGLEMAWQIITGGKDFVY